MSIDWNSIKTKKEALAALVSSLSDISEKQKAQGSKYFANQKNLHKEFLDYQKKLGQEILVIKEVIKCILTESYEEDAEDIPMESAFCAPKKAASRKPSKTASSKPTAGPTKKEIDGITYRVGDYVEVTEPGKGFTDDPKFAGATIVKFTEKRVYVQLQGDEKATWRAFHNIRFMEEMEDEENKEMGSSHSSVADMDQEAAGMEETDG